MVGRLEDKNMGLIEKFEFVTKPIIDNIAYNERATTYVDSWNIG